MTTHYNKVMNNFKHPSDDYSEEQLNKAQYRHLNLNKKSNFKICKPGDLFYVVDNSDYFNQLNYGFSTTTNINHMKYYRYFPTKDDLCVLGTVEELENDIFPIMYNMEFYNFASNRKHNVLVGDNQNLNLAVTSSDLLERISVFKVNINYIGDINENLLFSAEKLKKIKEILSQ